MQYCRWLLLTLIAILLQACAATRIAEEINVGRCNFVSGNYQCAFHQLLPAAVEGHPVAQYAVGYMYYYGYGVPRDAYSGIFWMQRSAAQGCCLAKKALWLIHQHELYGEYCPGACGSYTNKLVTSFGGCHDEILAALPRRAVARPLPSPRVFIPHEPIHPIIDEPHPILAPVPPPRLLPSHLPPHRAPCGPCMLKRYSYQLFGGYDLEHVKRLQCALGLKQKSLIWKTTHNGKPWFVLTYGNFSTVEDAKNAKQRLPLAVKDQEPWLRNLEGMDEVG